MKADQCLNVITPVAVFIPSTSNYIYSKLLETAHTLISEMRNTVIYTIVYIKWRVGFKRNIVFKSKISILFINVKKQDVFCTMDRLLLQLECLNGIW